MIKKGIAPSNLKQVDGSIVKKNDGTLEASLTFVTEKGKEALLPIIGSSHPDETNLECYNKTITYGVGELITCTCAYFGIEVVKTSPVVSYDGGTNNDPIETHQKFDELAGDVTNPLNGAQFVTNPQADDYGVFIKFSGDTDFRGVAYYLSPANNVSVTYWTTRKPNLGRRMSIVSFPDIGTKPFFKPPNVKNYLLVDMPYRTQGNIYQVTEQYMGSASGGWNKLIY